MKRATVYQRGDVLYLHSSSKTSAGVWIATPPYAAVSAQDAGAKKEAIGGALAASRQDVPHPKEWKGFFDPMLRLAKVKSWAAFQKGSRCVEVSSDGVKLKFVPHLNLGSKEGFKAKEEAAVEIDHSAAADDLSDALDAAISRCG